MEFGRLVFEKNARGAKLVFLKYTPIVEKSPNPVGLFFRARPGRRPYSF
jgi:hypothetical protein